MRQLLHHKETSNLSLLTFSLEQSENQCRKNTVVFNHLHFSDQTLAPSLPTMHSSSQQFEIVLSLANVALSLLPKADIRRGYRGLVVSPFFNACVQNFSSLDFHSLE